MPCTVTAYGNLLKFTLTNGVHASDARSTAPRIWFSSVDEALDLDQQIVAAVREVLATRARECASTG
jgi:hypothetical protein